ncbi:MAG: FtsQ-type POTRA domain-containing protein [Alphaproteobacteria bacterium]|jgi:cell division protein FtsQ|nr:FtsQ-type POTRA domain-containing protein [Alphaproteobacteria bacterium]
MKKTAALKKSKRGQPRRRVISFWRHRHFRTVLMVVLIALGLGGGWGVWRSDLIPNALEKTRWAVIAASTKMGFKVDEILVIGRNETKQKELLSAVRLARGAPILAFDLEAAQKRVEALPWVRKASVERMLPDTVLLNVEEREPLVLWQHKGAFALIDTDGEVILRKGLERFSDLLVVVGADAPKHAAKLLQALATEPELMDLVKAAVRVGGRRWNLRLKGDIDVRLPETDAAAAWTRLAEYEKTHQVLARDVRILDLRMPDRLIVRRPPRPAKPAKGKRQET